MVRQPTLFFRSKTQIYDLYLSQQNLTVSEKQKLIIGRKEIADLPKFGLEKQIVKVDTGAYTSSIHVMSAQIVGDFLEVRFDGENAPIIQFSDWLTKKVRSSNGVTDNRFAIKGSIVLGGKSYSTFFTLTSRARMRYPILLGRKFLNNRFIVDTSKVNVLSEK